MHAIHESGGVTARADLELLYPLNEFYMESGLALPSASLVEAHEIPPRYRRILAHDQDMTPTLEAAYGQSLHLRVLQYSLRESVFSRLVLLVLDGTETAVAMGAIKIYLERFPEEARRLVLERQKPLGTILRLQGIEHRSHPVAYFQVTPDELIRRTLRTNGAETLYGRRNVLWDASGRALARVLEILPFADGETASE